jgi:hypothetical protein
MKEIWKDIPGYIGLYQVSNWGQVKNTKTGKLKKPYISTTGYYSTTLWLNSTEKKFKIHQLVAMAFLGHEPNGFETVVNHIDNNPLNNHVDNLEIVSQRHNTSCHKIEPGIYWGKDVQKWKAGIYIKHKRIHLGNFTDKQDALVMYQKAVVNIHLYNGNNKAFRLALALITL